jgi:hypothetical protein
MEELNKKCSTCCLIKTLSEFNYDKRAKDGRTSNCRICSNIRNKKYREGNKEKEKIRKKEWTIKNKEHIFEYSKEYKLKNIDKVLNNNDNYKKNNEEKIKKQAKKYRENNKDKIKELNKIYRVKKLETDSLFKLRHNIDNLIRISFKNYGYNKKSKTSKILGCSYEEFKTHLESKFEPWMNWENRGLYNGTLNYGWDMDHIIPLSSATYEEDIIRLNHYSNLQPLCSYTNRYIKRNS